MTYLATKDLSNIPDIYYAWATLLRVKDGDTATIRRDIGHGVFFDCTIRLEGYNAPEFFRPKSFEEKQQAILEKERLNTILSIYQPFLTQTLYTQRVPRGLKSFDRWRSHVWIQKDNNLISVAQMMSRRSLSGLINV